MKTLTPLLSLLVLSVIHCHAQPLDGGGNFSVMVCDDGNAYSCGHYNYGQLGTGSTSNQYSPVYISGLQNVVAVSGGDWNHGMALTASGDVYCWGRNDAGQLGDSTTIQSSTPVQAIGLTNVIAISAGFRNSMALRDDSTVWVWGENQYGQLGIGSAGMWSTVPVQVPGLTGVVKIAAGRSRCLALKADGTVWSWGWNFSGALGWGFAGDVFSPTQIGLDSIVDIATGSTHGLALRSDSTIWSWGDNQFGQVGDSTTWDHYSPVQLTQVPPIIGITCGDSHSMILAADSTVWTWGRNTSSQLGRPASGMATHEPDVMTSISGVEQIAAGAQTSFAIMPDGTAWAWGAGSFGQLGTNNGGGMTPKLVVVPCLLGSPCTVAAGISQTASDFCLGDQLTLNSASNGATNYQWVKDGQPYSTAMDTVFDFTTIGTTTFDLIVDNGTCSDTSSIVVNVHGPEATATPDTAICQGDTIMIFSQAQTTAGTYQDSLNTIYGCDSIVSTTLWVNPVYSTTNTHDICAGDSVWNGQQYVSAAGQYTTILSTVEGCDSTIISDVTVTTVDTGVVLNNYTLEAQATNATYQWIDCATNTPIPGETAFAYQVPGSGGSFAVIVTQAGCTDTSACYAFFPIGFTEKETWEITISPNPVSQFTRVTGPLEDAIFLLHDYSGQLIFRSSATSATEQRLDLSELPSGVYLLTVESPRGVLRQKLLKL